MFFASRELTLLVILMLDSICYGLLYPFLSPYVLQLGGDHITLGILSVGILAAALLSEDVANLFTHVHGKKFALCIILNIAAITHILLVLTESYWLTILVRILFSLINQSQEICKDLLVERSQEGETRKLIYTSSILGGVGYIIGPIISGYLFEYSYAYCGIVAVILTALNICLVLYNVPGINESKISEPSEKSVLNKALERVSNDIDLVSSANVDSNWDLLAIKYLFTASVTVFFTKFTQILKHNYNASSVTIGYTTAYINLLIFIFTLCIPKISGKYKHYPTDLLAEISFLLLTFSMLFACYAPMYEFFAFMLIPIILVRTYLNTVWNELYQNRKNESLNKLITSVSIASGLSVPILFGITCNHIQHHAVILFSVAPLLSSFYIVKKYTRNNEELKSM